MFKGTKTNGPKKDEVFCTICLKSDDVKKRTKSVAYNNSTSGPMYHLIQNHKEEFYKVKDELAAKEGSKASSNQNLITSYAMRNSVKMWPKSSEKWKKATKLLAKWVVTASRPIRIVEDKGLRDYSSSLCPEYEIPCRNTNSNHIEAMYDIEKANLILELKKAKWISIT